MSAGPSSASLCTKATVFANLFAGGIIHEVRMNRGYSENQAAEDEMPSAWHGQYDQGSVSQNAYSVDQNTETSYHAPFHFQHQEIDG